MKRFYWVVLSIIVFLSCKKEQEFKINGTITNSEVNKVYLEKLEVTGTVPFDSAKIDKKGNFKFEREIKYPTFFLLKLNANKFITLLLDSAEQVKFSADYVNFTSDYKIEGSIGSLKVQQLNQQLAKTNFSLDSINSLIRLSQQDYDFEYKNEKWVREKQALINKQTEFSKKFVTDNPFSLASVLAIYQRFNDNSYIIDDLQTIKMVASALHAMYPKSEHAKALYEDTKNMMQTKKNIQMQELIKKYGRNSPEIVLPDQHGKDIALSSLSGKYVLVHFWSALDPTCRTMNEILLENYQQFKNKKFDIYQVSIDTSRIDWVKAIDEDNLPWTNVGDMKGSTSAISNYNITAIPSNYLLDPEGRIVAKDLKGPAIHSTLSKLLN